jgi:AhpD family alkylhydroperoxidase
MSRKYHKRTYGGLREFLSDVRFVTGNRGLLKSGRRKGFMTSAFQERLMVAVTAVNGCRYCSWVHTREALKQGIGKRELDGLFSGDLQHSPEDERTALLYAQHWADSNANPSPEAVQRLSETYGDEKAAVINVVLRMIRVGNLMGNTWDYFLYRLSFGILRG